MSINECFFDHVSHLILPFFWLLASFSSAQSLCRTSLQVRMLMLCLLSDCCICGHTSVFPHCQHTYCKASVDGMQQGEVLMHMAPPQWRVLRKMLDPVEITDWLMGKLCCTGIYDIVSLQVRYILDVEWCPPDSFMLNECNVWLLQPDSPLFRGLPWQWHFQGLLQQLARDGFKQGTASLEESSLGSWQPHSGWTRLLAVRTCRLCAVRPPNHWRN